MWRIAGGRRSAAARGVPRPALAGPIPQQSVSAPSTNASSRSVAATTSSMPRRYRPPVELHGERVVLRPLAEADVPRLVDLGAAPEVARWWPGLTEKHLLPKARGED